MIHATQQELRPQSFPSAYEKAQEKVNQFIVENKELLPDLKEQIEKQDRMTNCCLMGAGLACITGILLFSGGAVATALTSLHPKMWVLASLSDLLAGYCFGGVAGVNHCRTSNLEKKRAELYCKLMQNIGMKKILKDDQFYTFADWWTAKHCVVHLVDALSDPVFHKHYIKWKKIHNNLNCDLESLKEEKKQLKQEILKFYRLDS